MAYQFVHHISQRGQVKRSSTPGYMPKSQCEEIYIQSFKIKLLVGMKYKVMRRGNGYVSGSLNRNPVRYASVSNVVSRCIRPA